MTSSAPETIRLRIMMIPVFGLGLVIQALSILFVGLDKVKHLEESLKPC